MHTNADNEDIRTQIQLLRSVRLHRNQPNRSNGMSHTRDDLHVMVYGTSCVIEGMRCYVFARPTALTPPIC